MHHCLATSLCDCPHSRAGTIPGGGLYSMVSTKFLKVFAALYSVPNKVAVSHGLLIYWHKLLRDES